MTDLYPAAVMAAHRDHFGDCHYPYFGEKRCEPYRLAEALTNTIKERNEARARAVMLRRIVEGVDEAIGHLPYDDCLIDYDDHPEQAS